MFIVTNIGTQVAGVPILVPAVRYPIVISVVVASVANAIIVSILLPRVWSAWTIVSATLLRVPPSCDLKPSLVSAGQILVGVAVQVGVLSAVLSVSCPPNPACALDRQGVEAPGLSFNVVDV